ncbi:HIRAN domain-containing protein [Mariniblastus fucicola]|uniref:HIRAN domain-containing protein n=1 Tax=Mariniblastus fucicola TaxID=980251 RepID=UPI00138FC323|nr:HIRAN domain-containing protein [Mariniblastus fucicola]
MPKKLILSDTVGPMSDIDLLSMHKNGALTRSCEVKSAKFTANEWVVFNTQLLAPVQQMAKIVEAETLRLEHIAERKANTDKENKNRLRKFIQQAISDGILSSDEKSTIEQFASKAKLDLSVVNEILTTEVDGLVESLIDDALEDGILSPDEEKRINSFAVGLETKIKLTSEKQLALKLSRQAYRLNMTELAEFPEIDASVNLQKNERVLARQEVEWNEIVQLKRPKGIWVSGDNYLKSIGRGYAMLTSKRILFDSSFESRKATHSSIQRIEVFADGIFCSRSTGKSLFFKFEIENEPEGLEFALLLKRILINLPVQGFLPTTCLIPEQVVDAEVVASPESESKNIKSVFPKTNPEPRFTFRVVGEHIGDRSYWIQKLAKNEPLQLVREPTNSNDRNAVEVRNSYGKSLGYLKKDVAAWFAGLMDRGKGYTANVLRIRSDNCLIVAVFEQ